MLNLDNRLFVFHDDNNTFIDHSVSAQDYSRDEFSVVLNKDEDYLYIGFYKPINALYVEMKTINSNNNKFTLEYYNGVSFVSIDPHSDETKGFTRSGFIAWLRNLTDEAKTEIDTQEAFWYRLRPSVSHLAGTEIQGLNIVFSDDNDLKNEIFDIDRYLNASAGQVSFINAHVAARDKIIQYLRNKGIIKLDFNTGRFKNINIFDILDIGQLREAAKWKALATIFDDVSDEVDDKWNQRASKFNSRFNTVMGQLQFLGIDSDDDGKADINEEQSSFTMTIVRR